MKLSTTDFEDTKFIMLTAHCKLKCKINPGIFFHILNVDPNVCSNIELIYDKKKSNGRKIKVTKNCPKFYIYSIKRGSDVKGISITQKKTLNNNSLAINAIINKKPIYMVVYESSITISGAKNKNDVIDCVSYCTSTIKNCNHYYNFFNMFKLEYILNLMNSNVKNINSMNFDEDLKIFTNFTKKYIIDEEKIISLFNIYNQKKTVQDKRYIFDDLLNTSFFCYENLFKIFDTFKLEYILKNLIQKYTHNCYDVSESKSQEEPQISTKKIPNFNQVCNFIKTFIANYDNFETSKDIITQLNNLYNQDIQFVDDFIEIENLHYSLLRCNFTFGYKISKIKFVSVISNMNINNLKIFYDNKLNPNVIMYYVVPNPNHPKNKKLAWYAKLNVSHNGTIMISYSRNPFYLHEKIYTILKNIDKNYGELFKIES